MDSDRKLDRTKLISATIVLILIFITAFLFILYSVVLQ